MQCATISFGRFFVWVSVFRSNMLPGLPDRKQDGKTTMERAEKLDQLRLINSILPNLKSLIILKRLHDYRMLTYRLIFRQLSKTVCKGKKKSFKMTGNSNPLIYFAIWLVNVSVMC